TRWPRDWSSDVCSSDLRVAVREQLLQTDQVACGPDLAGAGCLRQRPEDTSPLRCLQVLRALCLLPGEGLLPCITQACEDLQYLEIGRASCRERGGTFVV